MESSALLTELSKCVRCGSCKAHCPTYDHAVTEAMGARGRLTLVKGLLTDQLTPTPLLTDRIFSCILCGACENLCPPQVNITEAIYQGRNLLHRHDPRRKYLRMLTRFSLRRPELSYRVARLLNAMARPALAKLIGLPFPIPIAAHPLRDDQQVYKPEKKIGRVALFTGCSINYVFPHLGVSLINVLLHLGYEVVLPKGEMCCGVPLRSLGLDDQAASMARRNHAIFSKLNTDAILSLCPTCLVALRHQYPHLIGEEIGNVLDIATFLADRLKSFDLKPLGSLASVTYHDPCHLIHSLGVRDEPRALIRACGTSLVEAEGEGCCGFGGVFCFQYQDISRDLLSKRTDACGRTGADAVITACPGCMLQLGSGLGQKTVYHLIELIEEALC